MLKKRRTGGRGFFREKKGEKKSRERIETNKKIIRGGDKKNAE